MGAFLEEIFATPQQLEGLSGTQVMTSMVIALICGLVVFVVYRFFNHSVVYSARFNMLIVMVTVITALIIITIGTNLVLTLGMVGALSIVRFRAAVKDPLDVGFLFWGLAAGLTAGAQLYAVALLGTAFIAVVYILLTVLRFEKRRYLLIVRYSPDAENTVTQALRPLRARVKNKTAAAAFSEITVEAKIGKKALGIPDEIRAAEGVDSVTLVEYTGDYS